MLAALASGAVVDVGGKCVLSDVKVLAVRRFVTSNDFYFDAYLSVFGNLSKSCSNIA